MLPAIVLVAVMAMVGQVYPFAASGTVRVDRGFLFPSEETGKELLDGLDKRHAPLHFMEDSGDSG